MWTSHYFCNLPFCAHCGACHAGMFPMPLDVELGTDIERKHFFPKQIFSAVKRSKEYSISFPSHSFKVGPVQNILVI